MPIIRSAKKALRSSGRKKVYNLRRKSDLQDALRKIKKASAAGNMGEMKTLLAAAYKSLDKAAKTGVIKKNTASRKKSRLAKLAKKTSVK